MRTINKKGDATMTQRNGTFYEVHFKSGNGGLCRTPDSETSVEGSRALIDATNADAVKRGFKTHQFSIFKVEWSRWFDEDTLMFSTRTETFVEIYPKFL